MSAHQWFPTVWGRLSNFSLVNSSLSLVVAERLGRPTSRPDGRVTTLAL